MPAVCSCEAARGVAARARDRALFAAAVDAIRERQLLLRALLAVASCWLKLASGCKTLASKPHGRTAVGVSEDLSLAATSFVSFVVYVLLLDLTSASQRLALVY